MALEAIGEGLDKFGAVVHGLETIEDLAKWTLADEKRDAYETLHTIAVIVDTLRGTFEGKISAVDTEDEISSLRHAIMGVAQRFDLADDS